MTRLQALIRAFFGFSRTETNAFIVLIPLMMLLIFSEPAYRYWFVRQPLDFTKEKKELDSLMRTWKWDETDSVHAEPSAIQLYSFDPNRISKNGLVELGFNNHLAERIVNYRLKGGKFFVKSDLLKIYGMDLSLYQRIIPYIELPARHIEQSPDTAYKAKSKQPAVKFDLNLSDTSQLQLIYGIGPKLSKRIVSYRNKLGGFVLPDQLNEVYGLDSSAVRALKNKSFIDENFRPRLININTATEKELADHPYIKYKLAKAIAVYRYQHGPFQSLEDLNRIQLMDDLNFQKIKPYLSANP